MLSFYLSMLETEEEKNLVEFLYTNYRQLMFRNAMSILRNEVDSEDAVHEAFLRVTKNLSKFRKYSCQENTVYLVIIVKGISLNILKKKNNAVELDEYVESPHNTENYAETHLTYERVRKNIEKLTPALKNVAMLCMVGQLTANEAAELLDIKLDTVYQRIKRARTILESEEQYDE